MQGNFTACVSFTLSPEEDGQPYHVTVGDAGGATAWGITRGTLSRWIRRPASIADVEALTVPAVTPIYKAWYWMPIAGDDLPAGVDLMLFDHGVVGNEEKAVLDLQHELGVPADGHVGPVTLAACGKMDLHALVMRLAAQQEKYYRACVDFPKFGNGWLNRLARRADASMRLLQGTMA